MVRPATRVGDLVRGRRRRTARSAPDVALSMMLHTTELKLNGRFFAFARDDTIVVKLNRPGFRGGSGVWFSVPGFGWVW